MRLIGTMSASPDQPHSWSSASAKLFFPVIRFGRLAAKIGHIVWNGRRGGLERQRQAHQWALIVEGRQRFARFDQIGHTLQRREKSDKRFRRLQNNRGAEIGNRLRVAAKLNCVAEALL